MIDITIGDVITYKEVEFEYHTIFEKKPIKIMTYNNETIIAEKFESIISRNIDNTRMKDYYDLYMFTDFKWDIVDKKILKEAIDNTAKNRNTVNYIKDANKYIELIKNDNKMKLLWDNYRNNYNYAKDIKFEDAISAIKIIYNVISEY